MTVITDTTLQGVDIDLMPANVVQAIARVEAEIGGIEKLNPAQRAQRGRGVTEAQGITYAYRSIDQIAAAAQPLFGRYGVIFVPDVLDAEAVKILKGQNSSMETTSWYRQTVTVRWKIYGPGGASDFITAETIGVGDDNSDKGMNKAMTAAFKNVLLRVLCIGDPFDDPDQYRTEEDGTPQRRQTATTFNGAAVAGTIDATLDEWAAAWGALPPAKRNLLIKFGRDTLGVRNISDPGDAVGQMMWALRNVEAGRGAGEGPPVAPAEPDPVELSPEPENEPQAPTEPAEVEPPAAPEPAKKAKGKPADVPEHDHVYSAEVCTICGKLEPF